MEPLTIGMILLALWRRSSVATTSETAQLGTPNAIGVDAIVLAADETQHDPEYWQAWRLGA